MREIQLLDCTLRDGGYLNDWEFGRNNILSIYQRETLACVDIIEVGFIDDRRPYDINKTIFPNTQVIASIFDGIKSKAPMTVGMIDYGTCMIENVQSCEESWLDGIRVIFKKGVMREAMEYCLKLKKLGYKVFSQLVSITSYSETDLQDIIRLVNEVKPYAVSMVDTYGLLTPLELLKLYEVFDNYVDPEIRIGFHAHNNMQLGVANAIAFIQRETERNIIVDGTLYGMGKSAGNDPIEIIADYLNRNYKKEYQVNQMLEAIEESILDMYVKYPWDYKVFFYLQARNRCHPKYVSFLQNKCNLSVTDMDQMLSRIQPEDSKLMIDSCVVENLYDIYLKEKDDTITVNKLKNELSNRKVLLIGPGRNIFLQSEKVEKYIKDERPYCIAINYIPELYNEDENIDLWKMVFVTNNKRFLQMTQDMLKENSENIKLLATSNVTEKQKKFDYVVNREPLLERNEVVIDNSFLMMLKVLAKIGVSKVMCAGFDGYSDREDNYFRTEMEYGFLKGQANYMNRHIRKVINDMSNEISVSFLTYSNYENEE